MNSWKLIITEHLKGFFDTLSKEDRAKVESVLRLFKEFGPMLPQKYLKRMAGTKELWELRAKNARIFLIIAGSMGIAVHGIIKKSQKTPKQDIDLAKKRAAKAREDFV